MLLINSFESKILYNSPMAIEHLGARGDDPWKHTFTRLVSSPQTSQRGFPSRFEITVTFFPKPLILVIIFTPKKQNKIPKYSMKHPFDHPSGGHLTPKKGVLKTLKKGHWEEPGDTFLAAYPSIAAWGFRNRHLAEWFLCFHWFEGAGAYPYWVIHTCSAW